MAEKGVVVELDKDKETKNTVRYAEGEEDRDKQKVGKLYLPNKTFEKLGKPDSIKVSIASA